MAEAFETVSQDGLVRETLAGTLSRWKERGFYVDVSSTQELLSDPKEVTKEQAEECLAYAQSAVAKLLR
jgi:AbiV family abortive infection protein